MKTNGMMKVYTIWDAKAETHTQPFFADGEPVAVRMFERAAMETSHTMHTHPGDFTLFEIAEWDDIDGLMHPHEVKRSIINAIHLPFWKAERG